MRRDDPRAGFTLLEVLATLVITTAFVAVALPYAGRLVTHWWIGETALDAADAWMQAASRMSDDLAQAVPFRLDRGGTTVVAFEGETGTIRFVRPVLGAGTGVRLERVGYEVRATAEGEALVRRSAPFDASTFGREAPGSGAAATLLDGPFRFHFVSVARDGTRRPTWALAEHMPASVELIATTAKGARAPLPALLMPIVAREAPTPPAVTAAQGPKGDPDAP